MIDHLFVELESPTCCLKTILSYSKKIHTSPTDWFLEILLGGEAGVKGFGNLGQWGRKL